MISSYAPPASHLVAGMLKRRFPSVNWVADYRDLWIEHQEFKGLFPFTLLEKKLESTLVRNADLLTSVSPPLCHILKLKFGLPALVVWNGFDKSNVAGPADRRVSARQFVLAYTGTVYPQKQDPSSLFRAIERLDRERKIDPDRFQVVFVGQYMDYVRVSARRWGVLRYVRFLGPVSHDESLEIQRKADALLFLDWLDSQQKGIVTGKLFEYLACEKPIMMVTAGHTIACNIAEEAGLALIARDTEECCFHINELLEGKVDLNPNHDFIDRFHRRRQVAKLYEQLSNWEG